MLPSEAGPSRNRLPQTIKCPNVTPAYKELHRNRSSNTRLGMNQEPPLNRHCKSEVSPPAYRSCSTRRARSIAVCLPRSLPRIGLVRDEAVRLCPLMSAILSARDSCPKETIVMSSCITFRTAHDSLVIMVYLCATQTAAFGGPKTRVRNASATNSSVLDGVIKDKQSGRDFVPA